MTIDPQTRVSISWSAIQELNQGALDFIFSGSLFSIELPDPTIDRYELELFSSHYQKYINQGYFYAPRADLVVADSENVKVRIRALLRDETKTPWVESGTLILSTFDFSDAANTLFLSFV
tara:strand:- start:407 stop:766 length:360 start_codon:yes stop_codon:yes gene_type:complete